MTIQELERIFRLVCESCGRPAVSLDTEGSPRCPSHVDSVIRDGRPAETQDEDAA